MSFRNFAFAFSSSSPPVDHSSVCEKLNNDNSKCTSKFNHVHQLRLLLHCLPKVLAVLQRLLHQLDEERKRLCRGRLRHRTNDLDKGIRRDTVRKVVREAGQSSQPRQTVKTLCVGNKVTTVGNMLEEPFEELHDR